MKTTAKISAFLPLAMSLVWLQFLPDRVPLHYNFAGEIDRWGSKWETLLLPGITILLAAGFSLAGLLLRRQAGTDGKAAAQAESNCKILRIVLLASALLFTVLQAVLLLAAGRAAEGTNTAPVPFLRITALGLAFLFIVLGNLMPRSRMNGAVGLRCGWSTYNETTWRRSNRFGGWALAAAGLVSIPAALLVPEAWAVPICLGAILIATVVSLIYAKKVYDEETRP